MFHLIPPPAHRLGLRIVHAIRLRFRRLVKPDLAGVAVLLRDEAGRVLLVRHSYGPTGWAMPGGGMGGDEDAADAARREMREELGCELGSLECVKVIEENLGGSPHTAHIFIARPMSEPRVDNRELVDARWFAPHELGEQALTRLTAQRLRQMGLLEKR
ncbi:NUDIX hydrolase [Aurantiacibacter aquimixticola]|uniref:NUDIX domain-containing protein n=1 Tax=Aurantiacibacter aquimixticola TaxID=1958945 RepID=A0A419RVX2_9SPHN|nr:NUDIX domain-containing protein [Aurantiacibacter aquimixticola]RJY09921.1 NUDIX domain-containing protein [Aurantiacibacter aquimixticola]